MSQHYSYLRGRRLSAMLRLMLPLLLLAVSNAVDTSETSDKPNIVIILIDDMVSFIWEGLHFSCVTTGIQQEN